MFRYVTALAAALALVALTLFVLPRPIVLRRAHALARGHVSERADASTVRTLEAVQPFQQPPTAVLAAPLPRDSERSVAEHPVVRVDGHAHAPAAKAVEEPHAPPEQQSQEQAPMSAEDIELLRVLSEVAGSNHGIAYVCVYSSAWSLMLMNMLFTAHIFGGLSQVLLVAMDRESFTQCVSLPVSMPCVDGERFMHDTVKQHLRAHPGEEIDWNSPIYALLTWARPAFVAHVLSLTLDERIHTHTHTRTHTLVMPRAIVMLDADMVFVKSLTSAFYEYITPDAAPDTFACTCEQDACNMGFYLVRPHTHTLARFRALLTHASATSNDQITYIRVESSLPPVSKRCLPWASHWQSCAWSHPGDDSPLASAAAVSLHAVCLVGLRTKQLHMDARKMWFMPQDRDAQRELFRKHGMPVRD